MPVLLAAECSIALTTLPAVATRPDAKVLWLDAHADYNTPDTTPSGYLGGMALAGAVGRWEHGLGASSIAAEQGCSRGCATSTTPSARRWRAGVTVIGASPVETLVAVRNALDGAPVYVHLDLDVIDPEEFPAQFPAPGGLARPRCSTCSRRWPRTARSSGMEITAFEAPDDDLERQAAASVARDALEPLLDAIPEEAMPQLPSLQADQLVARPPLRELVDDLHERREQARARRR